MEKTRLKLSNVTYTKTIPYPMTIEQINSYHTDCLDICNLENSDPENVSH